MNRVAVAGPAFTQATGVMGTDKWGLFSLGLLAAAVIVLGVAIYYLAKSGRGPYLGKKKSRQKHHDR